MAAFNRSNHERSGCKSRQKLVALLAFTALILSCGSEDKMVDPPPVSSENVVGTVKDVNGNAYAEVLVTISDGTNSFETRTASNGSYGFVIEGAGSYDLTIEAPLATTVLTNLPVSVSVQADQLSTVDFSIETQVLPAHLIIGNVDIWGEIKNSTGNAPIGPTEPLYARNVWDPPIGLLTAIKAPAGNHVLLQDWETAQGNVMVNCAGNSADVEIALEGMIPNGTYTFWLNFLNTTRMVGEPISLGSDLIKIEPLGSPTANVIRAGADGTINRTIRHSSCILTESPALVMAILYHLNGNTYGAEHIPDPEEAGHMLVYFQ